MCIHAAAEVTKVDAADVADTMEDAMTAAAKAVAKAVADAIDMKTAVVILNWNTKGFLEEFLPGLISSVGKADGAEVIVADNASTDGSMEMMAEKFPDVRTLRFESNLGFTGGYNRAFRETESEYFLLINSDIEVSEGWLEPLVEWMDNHPDCGACAPKLHSYQERDKFEYAGAAGGYMDRYGYPLCRGRVLSRLETDRGQYDSPKDVFWATGACLLVRSSVYKALGGLDERFFAHMEEIDLCWRMQLQGWKVTVVPESVVWHVGGGTLPAASPFKLQLNFRNNMLMLSNNAAKTYALQMLTDGASPEKAVAKGLKKAGRLLCFRTMLNYAAAAVYLITLRWNYAKAVFRADSQYRKMRHKVSRQEIRKYLDEYGSKARVSGIYKGWIVLRTLIEGERIFTEIESEVL